MNSKSKSAITVIAYAIEKDTDSLKQLLKRNGVLLNSNVSKDELQVIVSSALAKSETFKHEFKNWVLERTQFSKYANVTGGGGFSADPNIVGGGINYQPGQSGVYQVTNSATQQTFGGLTINPTTPSAQTTTPSAQTPAQGGWGINMATILDFAKDGLNVYALSLQTKNESTISDNALAIERNRINNPSNNNSSTNTVLIATVAIISVIGIFGGIYFYKNKKA